MLFYSEALSNPYKKSAVTAVALLLLLLDVLSINQYKYNNDVITAAKILYVYTLEKP